MARDGQNGRLPDVIEVAPLDLQEVGLHARQLVEQDRLVGRQLLSGVPPATAEHDRRIAALNRRGGCEIDVVHDQDTGARRPREANVIRRRLG